MSSETFVPSIWINAPEKNCNEEHNGSSLKDDLRFQYEEELPAEVSIESTKGFDEIADKVIDAFTIKTADRFIDSDEGIISNEDSEKRLIIMGSVLGIILNVTMSALLVLASMVFSGNFEIMTPHPSLESSYPTPYLLIMAKLGLGDMIILRQNKALNFEIDFNFKVPPNKASSYTPSECNWMLACGRERSVETGFSVFEDQGDLFIVYSDTSKRIVVLNPSNKHKTLVNSQLPSNHFYSNSIIRTGDFVWIFGGYSVRTGNPKSFNHSDEEFENHGCSSIEYGADESTFTGSAMWHMEKQVWFEGPSLPIKTCSIEATAISLNKTDVLIFIGPFINSYLKHVEGEEWINDNGGCIQLLHFSYNTFSWISQHDCFIDFGPRNYSFPVPDGLITLLDDSSNILSLISTSVFDKDGNMYVHKEYFSSTMITLLYF